jgi:hypothetical protein
MKTAERKVIALDTPKVSATAHEILDEAISILQARGRVYADPVTNHFRISQLWSTYLETAIEPHQVAVCMALVKIARSMETPDHLDSYTDGAAYLGIAGELGTMDWDSYGSY